MKAVVSTVMSKLSSPAQECYFSRSNENAIEGNRQSSKEKEMAVNRAVFEAVKRLLFYMTIEKF